MPTLPLETIDASDVEAESFTTNLLEPLVESSVAVVSPAFVEGVKVSTAAKESVIARRNVFSDDEAIFFIDNKIASSLRSIPRNDTCRSVILSGTKWSEAIFLK